MAEAKKKAAIEEPTAEGPIETQRYELVYLISNKFSEDEVGPIMSDVVGLLQKNGAKIVKEENWGKRKLAYPIGQFFHAYYAFIELDMPAGNMPKIDNALRLDERVLRHLIVKTRIKSAKELEAEAKAAAKFAEEQAQRAGEKEKERAPEESRDKDAGKVTIEKLDEKLEKIIDDAESLV